MYVFLILSHVLFCLADMSGYPLIHTDFHPFLEFVGPITTVHLIWAGRSDRGALLRHFYKQRRWLSLMWNILLIAIASVLIGVDGIFSLKKEEITVSTIVDKKNVLI